jgi:hypothetical protein
MTSLNSHFGSSKDTTTCGGGSERARVWIKVCNLHFQQTDVDFKQHVLCSHRGGG